MSDQSNVGADGQPQETNQPDEMVVRVNGTDVRMPTSKVVTLAQQGMNQQRVQEQIAADRSALEGDSTQYKECKRFQTHLAANPTIAKAVAQALENPSSVLNAQSDDGFGSDDNYDQEGAPQDTQAIADLRRELMELKNTNQARDEQDATTRQASAIDTEMSEYPWLKEEGYARKMAKSQIATAMSAGSGDLASVTAVVADDLRKFLEEARTKQANQVPGRRLLQTERPTRGTPPVSTDKPLTKADLSNGNMLKALQKSARAFGIPVD